MMSTSTLTKPNPENLQQPHLMGPRPLMLHLAMQTSMRLSCWNAWSGLNAGLMNWKLAPTLQKNQADLQQKLKNVDQLDFKNALWRQIINRQKQFANGVNLYHQYPRHRRLEQAVQVWAEGAVRLLDYSLDGSCGVPVLVVPSLINKSYILDLNEQKSLLQFLAHQGLRPYLIDWGAPGDVERRFDLTDYIAGPLQHALDYVHKQTSKKPMIVGYCMGGVLALALAARNPDKAGALALLATPWDFHCPVEKGGFQPRQLLMAGAPMIEQLLENLGVLPIDLIQAMFTSLDPTMTEEKFCHFASMKQPSTQAQHFIDVEDWLNDGVDLAGKVAHECLIGWYGENRTARLSWRVNDQVIKPSDVQCKSLLVIPGDDHIVPPASALALRDGLVGTDLWRLKSGHIGMIVGSNAEKNLFKPLAVWLKNQA